MKSIRSRSAFFGNSNGTGLQRTTSAPLPDRILLEPTVKPSDNPWLRVEQTGMKAPSEPQAVITWPKESCQVDVETVMNLVSVLKRCGNEPMSLRKAFTFTHVARLLRQVEIILQSEPNILPVIPSSDKVRLAVLGDTHGQFYDVINVFDMNGYPSEENWYLFNGDFVDRGSWGIELALTLFGFKILFPRSVHLIRGNHETLYCTKTYGYGFASGKKVGVFEYDIVGFLEECKHKYSKAVYQKFHSAFAKLPLASVILPLGSDPGPLLKAAHCEDPRVASGLGILVMHGGLYRNVDGSFGTISLLQSAKRVVKDPQNEVVVDTLWSDPQLTPGLVENEQRGCAVLFGPDITEAFLQLHGLSLLIRSHEGPDAREKRPEMPNNMMSGYAIDQTYPDSERPLCISIFSAPDYPMGARSRRNRAAFIRFFEHSLRTLEPEFVQFDAGDRPDVPIYIDDDSGELTDMEQ